MAEVVQEAAETEAESWYELGFSRGLTEPSLVLGVPTNALVMNALVAVFFLMNFHFWQILPISCIAHFGMVYVCKNDTRFFGCLQMYIYKKNYYST